ncbi:MAG: hypothetical protein IPG01_18730 [Chitinophagaceae bacterium]|nr:hypothetical protein [Chitinophagaceae bacterium]
MDDQVKDTNDDLTLHKLDQMIQKKKEEIAGLQKLLGSIEGANAAIPETEKQEQESGDNEKENQ